MAKYQKQAGAELSQAQVKLKVVAEVGVEIVVVVEVVVEVDFKTFPAGGCGKWN